MGQLLALGPVLVATMMATGASDTDERAEVRRLSLADCVRLALQQNPEIASAQAELDASTAERASARGAFGPKLRVEANIMRWDSAFAATLDMPGLPFSMPPFRIRDPITRGAGVSLVEPFGSLWSIFEGYNVRALGVDIAKIRREITRRDLAYHVSEAFYRLVQAERLAEVAQKSVAQLEAQAGRARIFNAQGVVGQNDVLRADLGLANAKQRLIQARGNVTVLQGRLAVLLGLPTTVTVEPTDVPSQPPAGKATTVAEAEESALQSRIEIRELDARIDQARGGVRAAWSKMLPQINGIASYQWNAGSMFQPDKAYFAGVLASWDFWEWGSDYYGTEEAQAHLKQARAARARLCDGVRIEARAAFVAQTTAAEALLVARSAVTQAEENFRLETVRYEARANTSFDVLDAEMLLTQARAQEQAVTYEFLIAQAALARAMGQAPDNSVGSQQ
jgi:outer membrane protein TolC